MLSGLFFCKMEWKISFILMLMIWNFGCFTAGFVISGKKILTNAHVVGDHTFVRVRKHGSPTKHRARVQAIGHECDLAILVVEDEVFREGMTFLELRDITFLQESVAVVGYPQGNVHLTFSRHYIGYSLSRS